MLGYLVHNYAVTAEIDSSWTITSTRPRLQHVMCCPYRPQVWRVLNCAKILMNVHVLEAIQSFLSHVCPLLRHEDSRCGQPAHVGDLYCRSNIFCGSSAIFGACPLKGVFEQRTDGHESRFLQQVSSDNEAVMHCAWLLSACI